ncbi:sulfatase [Polaribacter porphyrae]|uniref:sulfatase n=1 Tax=Polaribacter porphyrae TaxID=1137780 RepID=UPI001CFF8C51|nr:sulfatase [Polaribacter porphyrae]
MATTLFVGCQKIDKSSDIKNKKPNVIFILADDLGAHDLGFMGSKFYETPNLDALAKQGTIFTQGYAAAQVCSPSRASILLGKFTANHGITDWIGADYGKSWSDKFNSKIMPPNYKRTLPKEDITIAEAFKNNGYKTLFAGKWHLGKGESTPENHGFEVNIGGWEVGNPKGGYYAPWENPKLAYKYLGENLTKRLAEETGGFIEQHKDQPFFAFLSFYAVHTPLQTTEKKWKKYREKAIANQTDEPNFISERILPVANKQENPIYAGLVASMDDAVGVLMRKLKALNLDKNTIIVFTSDNGGLVSSRYGAFATNNLQLRGGKGYQWEGGIREPYVIKVPNLKNKPNTIDYPVSGVDFYPTLLDLAGISPDKTQKIDGISLKPILKGKNLATRSLFWHYPHYGNQGGEPVSIIRKGNWKLIHYWENNVDELYNLLVDIGEKNNVITQNEVIAVSLRKELDTFLADSKAEFPEINPNFDAKKSEKTIATRKQKMIKNLEKRRLQILDENFKPNKDWYNSALTKD